MAEAGTGAKGKTFAYLMQLIIQGEKATMPTETINLKKAGGDVGKTKVVDQHLRQVRD